MKMPFTEGEQRRNGEEEGMCRNAWGGAKGKCGQDVLMREK